LQGWAINLARGPFEKFAFGA